MGRSFQILKSIRYLYTTESVLAWVRTYFFSGKIIRCLLALVGLAIGQVTAHSDTLTRREWKVDGVIREALVYLPANAKTDAMPVVFCFHGHGGTMRHAARTFGIEKLWPDAIVVYMQGLNTPGRLTDPDGKKPGWQREAGDQNDRDLKFFDAVLTSLKGENRVDERRIYSTGHSNGGAFTYLLWSARGEKFAAFAPSAAAAGQRIKLTLPKPIMHIAGENDPLVKFSWQQATMNAVRKLNQCGEGTPWGKFATEYESKAGAPVVTVIHPGTHQFPAQAPAMIVKFFKEQPKPTAGN